MTALFEPPYPVPHRTRSTLFTRFVRGWHSWIHVMFERSYTMKMGEIHVPSLDFYIVNELPLVDRILGAPPAECPKHDYLRDLLDPLIGNSVFVANGADWERQRAMMTPAFSHAALGRVFGLMRSAVDDLVARVTTLDLSRPVAIDPLMTHVAADIIYRTMFSLTLSEGEAAEIHRAFARYQRHAQSASLLRLYRLPTFGYLRRARAAAQRIQQVFAPIVLARHAAKTGGEAAPQDILQALIDARDSETGEPFGVEELMGQVSTIFLAGHETAASAMGWALYLLSRAPHLQDRIVDEAKRAFEGKEPTPASLAGLATARDVFRETLRLYPPVSFLLREVIRPTEMRGKRMKPGAMLVVSPWLIHRNRDNWSCPHGFDPDRFSRPDARTALREAYLPFGKGPRVCIGAGFAQQEAVLLIVAMLRAFRLEPVPEDTPEPVSRLTLRARNGIRLLIRPRD